MTLDKHLHLCVSLKWNPPEWLCRHWCPGWPRWGPAVGTQRWRWWGHCWTGRWSNPADRWAPLSPADRLLRGHMTQSHQRKSENTLTKLLIIGRHDHHHCQCHHRHQHCHHHHHHMFLYSIFYTEEAAQSVKQKIKHPSPFKHSSKKLLHEFIFFLCWWCGMPQYATDRAQIKEVSSWPGCTTEASNQGSSRQTTKLLMYVQRTQTSLAFPIQKKMYSAFASTSDQAKFGYYSCVMGVCATVTYDHLNP